MKKIFLTLLFLICSLIAFSQAKWAVQSSEVEFKIKNAGFKIVGSFKDLSAQILFEPSNLDASNITASIEAKTINTGLGMRDNHLRKEEYFGVEKFPKITMKSVKFANKNKNNYVGTFQLTIKSITKNIEMPFDFSENGNSGVFNGSFTINRQDYNVGGNSWTMSDNVTINLHINVSKILK